MTVGAVSPSQVGWCDHGRRFIRQGTKKGGKPWRGEFCFLGTCEPVWWRFNEQIEVHGEVGIWIPPMYEPMDYVYHGIKGSPWADDDSDTSIE